jgi:hypothetical protein
MSYLSSDVTFLLIKTSFKLLLIVSHFLLMQALQKERQNQKYK